MKDNSTLEINNYCNNIYEQLNKEIYGIPHVKNRLIQIINNRIYNPKTTALVAFCGPPGIGKSLTPSVLAKVLDLPFDKISLGGMEDPVIIKGSDGVWLGSGPGIILKILKKMKYSNGIVLLDEIDKLHPRVQHAVLNILDYTQNHSIDDAYLTEFKHDISNIWFMVSMNTMDTLDPALLDRLDIIKMKHYTCDELTDIIQQFMLPDAIIDVGFMPNDLIINKEACLFLINYFGDKLKENGLRIVKKEIQGLVSKINLFRTIYKDKNSIVRQQLLYDLDDFNGIPYEITTNTISKLCKASDQDMSYKLLYL